MALTAGQLANFVAGEALSLAYDHAGTALGAWATKRAVDQVKTYFRSPDKNMLTQGGHVPVQISTGSTTYARKKTTKWKGKVPMSKQMSLNRNVLTYIWHATTPYHAKYGSIGIGNINIGTNTQTAYNTVKEQQWPMHLYDLTCAPNYLRAPATDSASTFQAGIESDNPYPFYNFLCQTNVKGNAATDYSLIPKIVTVYPGGKYGTQIVSQEPSGVRGECKWYLKYMKKPYSMGYTALQKYDTVPVGPSVMNDPTNKLKMRTPCVGYRPIHVSTKVRMCLVGCSSQPVTYDISLIRLKDDRYVPKQSWVNGSGDYGHTRTDWTLGNGNTDADLDMNSAALFWQQMALPFTHGPECATDKSIIAKGVQFLGTRVVTIQPKLTIDGDTQLNHEYISFQFDWNEVRSYGWRKDSDYSLNQAIPDYQPAGDDKHGTGFTTSIADLGNITTHVSPTSRIFLLVRCRSAIINNAANVWYPNTVDGATNYGTAEPYTNDNVPTYDISIENTFIPDHT